MIDGDCLAQKYKPEGNGNLQTCAKICLNTPDCIGIQTDHHFKYNCEIVIEGDPKSCATGVFEYHKRECLVYKNSVPPARAQLMLTKSHIQDMCTEQRESRYEPLGKQHSAQTALGCASICASEQNCPGSTYFHNGNCFVAEPNSKLVQEPFVTSHSCRSLD